MTRYKTQPPWEFLLSASRTSLQSYELTRLSHAANLRKEIGTLLDQWLDENSSAMADGTTRASFRLQRKRFVLVRIPGRCAFGVR